MLYYELHDASSCEDCDEENKSKKEEKYRGPVARMIMPQLGCHRDIASVSADRTRARPGQQQAQFNGQHENLGLD